MAPLPAPPCAPSLLPHGALPCSSLRPLPAPPCAPSLLPPWRPSLPLPAPPLCSSLLPAPSSGVTPSLSRRLAAAGQASPAPLHAGPLLLILSMPAAHGASPSCTSPPPLYGQQQQQQHLPACSSKHQQWQQPVPSLLVQNLGDNSQGTLVIKRDDVQEAVEYTIMKSWYSLEE
ncbi:hypothetical protein BS78_01G288600 [Paspalum vaginatum]|nr:hypothetical protein BS78_01G288600 [Paspalum vaginatum]KAJ1296287.1 hypothetical protein BS78_01G288600 [Paspalum vaginatum]KAJ1296288.1 hypothetical protein BS78_01G288600 [Paspalum vaginatum]